jgi:DnaK suppressor protein
MMTKAEMQTAQQRLLGMKRRIAGQLSKLEEQALRGAGGEPSGNLSNVPLHLADLASDNYEEEVALGLIENEDQVLTEINDALARIEKETYGRCEKCGRDIPKGRLDTIPYARYCVEDAQKNPGSDLT